MKNNENNKNEEIERRNKEYNEYVKSVTPTHNLLSTCFGAFMTGGVICLIGQGIINLFVMNGVDKDTATIYNTIILILISVILTGLNIFPSIVKFGGAGALVPITGFANGMAAPAMEFKKEGQVFGIGCKIFTIAGPVILYGIFTSFVLGVIYWLMKIM